MIVTGIFLFLLGTKIGQSSAINTKVEFDGPSKTKIKEQIDQSSIVLPEYGSAPNFIHQGSNYFFGPQIQMTSADSPSELKTIINSIEEKNNCNKTVFVSTPEINGGVIIEEGRRQIVEVPNQRRLPLPDISLDIKPIPYLPSIKLPILSNSQLLPIQLPIPGLSLLKTPKVPILTEGFVQTPGGYAVSEVDVEVKRIPPPPELPPLVLEKIIKPVIVEEKRVILVPALPELPLVLPPSLLIKEQGIISKFCTQDILYERILPNIAFEKTKTVELISIPATYRVPVVTTSVIPFLKK